MFKLLVSVRAQKRIKLLKTSHQEAILSTLQEIKEDPLIGKSLTRELKGRFSYRVGIYRIIYRVNQQDKTIRVLNAGHRATIYN
ncbi:type II toxin-antitoxin system RelE/ParE family toxin [Candidatus Daviesbacteria bacterium]|nr:type II toxin-antitoxin system RelE/ParE family toxin [Candidatus Daviesbacteria bacterium]